MIHEHPRDGHGIDHQEGVATDDLLTFAAQLKTFSAEVEHIARTIMTIKTRSDNRPISHADRRVAEITPQFIRAIIRDRRARDAYFKSELFADPAWDILLELTAARMEDRRVCISDLTIAAAVPSTTALRWIKMMTDKGMLVRCPDPTDARRCFVDLNNEAFEKMLAYLSRA